MGSPDGNNGTMINLTHITSGHYGDGGDDANDSQDAVAQR